MFPTRLNLLPPENQKYLQKMIFTEFIKNTLETVMLLLAVTGMALLGGQWVLQGYFNDLTETIITVSNKHSGANKKIKDINLLLKKTAQIQQDYILWTPFLSDLSASIPEGVILANTSMDVANKLFSITGLAKTRDDLIELQTQLELLPYISSLTIPPSQLTKKEDISFSLSVNLKFEKTP